MKRLQLFVATYKENDLEAPSMSLKLALRSGLLYQMASGLYAYTPLGFKVLQAIIGIIRREMIASGAQEVLLPCLEPRQLWEETGRWDLYGDLMFRTTGNDKNEYCLAPTCEEAIVDLVRSSNVRSHKQLPFTLYQVHTKYRNESVRQGLVRTYEFTMKDAYSFNKTEQDLDVSYQAMRAAYRRILDALGLRYVITRADSGEMGGSGSEEFLALTDIGTDVVRACTNEQCTFATTDATIKRCKDCKNGLASRKALELCHIFKLGDRYTKPMKLSYTDDKGKQQTVLMGCYGIGVSRLIPAIIEQHHDAKGICWPEAIAPFTEVVIATNTDKKLVKKAQALYQKLLKRSRNVLFDDRTDVSAGVKFAEADLLGIPRKIILGPKSLAAGKVEIELRDGKKEYMDLATFSTQYRKRY